MGMDVVTASKVLRWARVIQPLIPVEETLRNASLSGRSWGDGWEYGNGGGGGKGSGENRAMWRDGDGEGYGWWGSQDGDGHCENY